jgi:hypothetical protein
MNNFPCAVEVDLRRYLATLDEDDSRDEAIEQRTEELMADGGEYAPFNPDNLAEAISEGDIAEIAKLIDAGKVSEVGAVLVKQVRGYWEALARNEAERQIDNEIANACPRCRGRGCRHCYED